jgi:hypothetical protein
MEVKAEKDALRMREYRRRKQKDRETLEDFMAFVAERDLELFLEFQAKRVMKSSSEQEESLAAPNMCWILIRFFYSKGDIQDTQKTALLRPQIY